MNKKKLHRNFDGRCFANEQIYEQNDVSRQSHAQWLSRQGTKKLQDDVILNLVAEVRAKHPEMGGVKLYWKLEMEFEELMKGLGRDAFLVLLRVSGMLRSRHQWNPRTTNSRHRLRKYPNLILGILAGYYGQILVADITYIRVGMGWMYLSLITDLYSRKIVGWALARRLSMDGPLEALQMALKTLPAGPSFIHHSDRGSQYCSKSYTDLVVEHGGQLSMTTDGNVYENAVAERVNGILKYEYHLKQRFTSMRVALEAIEEAIWLYNTDRPHMSLGRRTPESVSLSGMMAA